MFSGTLRQCLCPYSQAESEGVSTEGLERLTDAAVWQAWNGRNGAQIMRDFAISRRLLYSILSRMRKA